MGLYSKEKRIFAVKFTNQIATLNNKTKQLFESSPTW
jgi:hypothetical protein